MSARLKAKPLSLLQELISRIALSSTSIMINVRADALTKRAGMATPEGDAPTFTRTVAARLTRTGHAMRLIRGNGGAAVEQSGDPHPIRLLVRGRRWRDILKQGEITPTALGKREGFSVSYLLREVRLAFLSPAIVTAILDGTLKADVDAARLLAADSYPLHWAEQEALLLPG